MPRNSSILAATGELAMSGHFAFLLLSISLSPTIVAQEQAPKLSREIAASPAQYRVLPGETDRDGCVPKTPARICLGATGMAHCYEPFGNKDYIFALEPKATPVGQLDGHDLTLFTAMFSGCGSGALTDFSLLTVRDEEFVNLLPKVQLTNQSEYKLWSLPRFSKLPILVNADFIWDFDAMQKSKYKEETHLASHRYRIEAFVFDTKSGRYLKKVHYETAGSILGSTRWMRSTCWMQKGKPFWPNCIRDKLIDAPRQRSIRGQIRHVLQAAFASIARTSSTVPSIFWR